MTRSESLGMLLSAVRNNGLVERIKRHKRSIRNIFAGIFAGLALLLMLIAAEKSSPAQSQLRIFAYGRTRYAEESWTMATSRAAGWETPRAIEDEEDARNWAGLERMRMHRAQGSLWWDESAEQYLISKLEKSQFPADCAQAHWIAKFEFSSGLLSSTHVFQLPLFVAMVRGHALVPISEPKPNYRPAFEGCGAHLADRNIHCYFNITNCNPSKDRSRLSQILDMRDDSRRTTWERLLMEDEDVFAPGGVTVIHTFEVPFSHSEEYVDSSSFASFDEAYNYHKLNLWLAMGRHGKVGAVTNSTDRPKLQSCGDENTAKSRRVDMVMASLMSSWMLNRMPIAVKLAADKIMSRYVDTSGRPMWKSPVLAIHIRETDKTIEDPYYREHEGKYRPTTDYALHIKQLEQEYGMEWPSVFVISDSGTAMEALMRILDGSDSTTLPKEKFNRFVMYDWTTDDHLVEKAGGHTSVPKALKHDMQTHFLATLYIVQKIADHAIVTFSSNVGRFIGEIMAAKHRLATADCEGPLVTSLDLIWFWS